MEIIENKKLSNTQIKVSISFSSNEIEKKKNIIFQSINQYKGFRPGNVPGNIVLKNHNKTIFTNIINELLNEIYFYIQEQYKDKVYRIIKYDIEKYDIIKKPYIVNISIIFDIFEDIILPKYNILNLKNNVNNIVDLNKKINNFIIKLQNIHSFYVEIENNIIQNEDKIFLNYNGKNILHTLGKIYPNSDYDCLLLNELNIKLKNFQFEINKKNIINIEKKTIIILKVLRKTIHPLNINFFKKFDVKNLDDFKVLIKNQLLNEENMKIFNENKAIIENYLLENTKLNLPESIVTKQNIEEQNKIKLLLIIEQIAKKEKIFIENNHLKAIIKNLNINNENDINVLKNNILINKVINFIIEKNCKIQ